jgi:UDP-N-acetylmuramoylalanine--D-glutamate ligase
LTASATNIRGERILILGMARSGFGAARLCLREGARVTCLDLKEPAGASAQIAALESAGVRFIWGPHPLEVLGSVDRIVKSPGVRGEIPFLIEARSRGIPIWSELELASRFARGPILGITGTNGKSTTTAWAADMLARCGRAHETVGNIGHAISDGVLEGEEGAVLVTEISSFQLEDVDSFRPLAAAILNFTPDHIDRHGDLASYREAKMRVFANQTRDDIAVVGEQDDLAVEVASRFPPRLLRFRLEDRGEEGAFQRAGRIGRRFKGLETILCGADQVSLPGPHNTANAMAALALLAPLDLPDEGLIESIRTFPGLAHRLEKCGTIRGVLYVNDSKATNLDSLSIALDAWGDAPLILLAGGRDKAQDFRPLAQKVRGRCRRVLLFGESKNTIRSQWGDDLCETRETMADAIDRAGEIAMAGEIVLLSPACASFDQFRDYEDRGDQFRALIRDRAEMEGGHR